MAQSDPLVSASWLAERLEAPDIRVVDSTWFLPGDPRDPRALHAERRIPGAIFFDIDEIADSETNLPHMLPSPEKFSSQVRKLGIGDGARVVAYDAEGIRSSARVWWMFRAMGHEDVVVLDGGLPAWEAEGLPVEEGRPVERSERHFTARYRADLVRDIEEVRWAVETGGALILDARPPGRFAGRDPEPRPGLRLGHMPGARNVPVPLLIGPDGRMRSHAALERVFLESGVGGKTPLICTCGSGVAAAIVALALARIGRWDAAVYDGSWTEWGALPNTPVAAEHRHAP